MEIVAKIGQALLLAAGMFWQVGWSLVLGFLISGLIQALVSKERMVALLGREGPREIALATLFGAASSSCSYASAAIMRSVFTKGAGFIPSLAFLFSSTNLVIELGIVLWLLIGWQFTAAEWIGGVVLVVVMSILVTVTYPRRLVEEARGHAQAVAAEHEHGSAPAGTPLAVVLAQNFAMDWSMLWWDLFLGFLIAGFIAAFIPDGFWHVLFLAGAPAAIQIPVNAMIGPLIAVVTFVCSIGNVPLAAVLWAGGVSFGGVLAFLYADLIVLPLLDVYRRYYGLKMAAYIGIVFYVTMVLAAMLMDLAFGALHLIPGTNPRIRADLVHFAFDYTFWLNLVFGALAAWLFWVDRKHPMMHHHH